VLTLDGHDTHETRQIICAAYDHNVIIIVLPLKMTHKLQPLDVGVFSSVQQRWSRHCNEHLAEGVPVNHYNFIPEYLSVHRTITPLLVQKAFAKTGIYHLNPMIFNDYDFAPSQAPSSIPRFPPSYPHNIPSSVLSEPSNMLGSSRDLDVPGLSNNNHSKFLPRPSPPLSPSNDHITHSSPSPIMSHQPMLPPLPPYNQVIHWAPLEIWEFM